MVKKGKFGQTLSRNESWVTESLLHFIFKATNSFLFASFVSIFHSEFLLQSREIIVIEWEKVKVIYKIKKIKAVLKTFTQCLTKVTV